MNESLLNLKPVAAANFCRSEITPINGRIWTISNLNNLEHNVEGPINQNDKSLPPIMDPRVVDEDPSHIELSTPLSELHKLYMVINLLQRILDNLRRSPRPSGIAEIKEFAYKVRVCRKVLTFVKKSFMTLHYWTFILDIVRNFGPVARPRSIITLYAENREEEPKMLMSVNNGKLVFSYAPPKDKAKKVSYCKYCAGEHKVTKCMVFNIISVDRRLSWAANNNICFKCCKPRHRSRVCRGKGCEVEGCGQPHHTLLHTEHSYQFTTLISATKKQ